MPIKLNGSTSGYAQVQAAATAANNTLTLPSGNGMLVGQSTTTAPINGQIPIGNGTDYTPAFLTASGGITITNGAGSVTIGGGGFANKQIYTSGTNTWTVPAGVTQCKVTVVGGGGGGNFVGASGGGGGGGGGTAIKWITGLTPGGTVTATVGAGGASANSGGTSSFGAYCSATGGAAGQASNFVGAAGGVGSSGDINIAGGYGGGSQTYSGVGNQGGWGGSSFLATSVFSTVINQATGTAGTGYGGGGGGGVATAGGAGSGGIIIIEY